VVDAANSKSRVCEELDGSVVLRDDWTIKLDLHLHDLGNCPREHALEHESLAVFFGLDERSACYRVDQFTSSLPLSNLRLMLPLSYLHT